MSDKKTLRVNKTKNNLQTVYKHLDNASGSIYNAIYTISHMVDLPKETDGLTERLSINVQDIDSLKQNIEKILDEK